MTLLGSVATWRVVTPLITETEARAAPHFSLFAGIQIQITDR